MPLHVPSTRAHRQEAKITIYYTTTGFITPTGVMIFR